MSSYRIETYHHGDDALWSALGPYFADRAVHAELGGPLYSSEGVTWFVALRGQAVLGFASLRVTTTAAWYDYAYVEPDCRGQGYFARLAAERARLALKLGLPLRTAVRSDRWPHYRERGWKVTSRRGAWVHGIKEVR